jgi:hypothetical protein
MAKSFTCERDGTVLKGETDEQLVQNVQRHVEEKHPDLVGSLTSQQILASSR